MNLANKLTLLRVLLIPVFVVVLLTGWVPSPMNRFLAVIIFIIASITDCLDGQIARRFHMVTNFGKFMDPLADKLLVTAAMVCMVEMGDLPAWIVIIIISREFIITGFRLIAVEAGTVIAASFWGKIKTVTQMFMIIFVLLGLRGIAFDMIKDILIGLALIFTVISGVDYIVKNRNVLKG
ncbi:MAG: CDP-diacylglycerol--glycerol-3-phosphate 3-phosphatidyltransferase [Clostridiales bacterium]|nr:CDP-diacylglycerol--glycerol-3-phosphate 3-phosphatidyltransferase [Clostridiales bacterium]